MVERNDVATEYNRFDDVHFDIITQNEILREKREMIDANDHHHGGGELKTVWLMDSWSASDNLKQRESELLGDRDKQQKINESIILLYMKILSYQSSRVDTIIKKLDNLKKKNPTMVCPADYTVQAFQEWTRTNPKIHAMQSEVLDMLAQKIKLRSRFVEEERSKRFSLQDFTGTLKRIRSETMFYLERDPLVDADFSLHVSGIVQVEAKTFEAERMRFFIRYCWDNKGTDDLGSMYQEFVGSLVEHIMTKYGHMRRSGQSKSDLTRDQIFAIVEGYLIPHIYDCIHERCPEDEFITKRYEVLRHVSQEEIGVKSCYIDHSIQPYNEAILKLKTLSLVKLPTQKLRAIILASQLVVKRMGKVCKKETVAGADEFIDVWVYVTLKAAITDTFWNVKYLKEFANPKYMLSETGYYLSSLEMASEYLKGLNADQMDFHISETQEEKHLLLPDTGRIRKLCCIENSPFELVCEDVELSGFEIVTTLEIMRNNCRLLQFGYIEKSDNTLTLLKIKVSPKYPWDIIERYLHIKNFEEILLEETEYGFIPRIFENVFNADKTIFHLSSFEEWSHLVCYSTIIYLGGNSSISNHAHTHVSTLANKNFNLMDEIRKNFSIPQTMCLNSNSRSEALKEVVKELQDFLKKLKYYSCLLPSDGFYSSILQKSMQWFQKDQNMQRTTKPFLREDGVCDLSSFRLLNVLAGSHYNVRNDTY